MGDSLFSQKSVEGELNFAIDEQSLDKIKVQAFHYGLSPAKSRAALAQSNISRSPSELTSYNEGQMYESMQQLMTNPSNSLRTNGTETTLNHN